MLGIERSADMPRTSRIDLPGLPQHLICRGNNRSDIFFRDGDRLVFLRYLAQACTDNDCAVHAFVLMSNHVHLLATGNASMAISKMMQDLGRRYVLYVNSTYERTGALYEGRFKSSLVETSSYFLTCMRYIELNPVRAGMAREAGEYPWSSFGQNAGGEPSGLVTPHPEYLQLSVDPQRRSEAYLRLFHEGIPDHQLAAIRRSASMNRALGGEHFCNAIEATLQRPVRVTPHGRPRRRR
jgi:putative transposase